MAHLRIGLVGCAGTGKTTLAEKISEGLSMPFLKSNHVTGEILERDGYDYASGIQVERFLAHMGRQNEMLRKTLEQQSVDRFVTDRTVVDLAAYVVLELRDTDLSGARDIFETCRTNAMRYTHLFVCPWREGPVAANNRRTLNPWYQRMVHYVELGILQEWGCGFHVLKAKTPESRFEEVKSTIMRQPDFWEDVGEKSNE